MQSTMLNEQLVFPTLHLKTRSKQQTEASIHLVGKQPHECRSYRLVCFSSNREEKHCFLLKYFGKRTQKMVVPAHLLQCNSSIVRAVTEEEGHVGPISLSALGCSEPCFLLFREKALLNRRIQYSLTSQRVKMKGSSWIQGSGNPFSCTLCSQDNFCLFKDFLV